MSVGKQLVKRVFNAFGLEIRKKRPEEPSRLNMSGALEQLERVGLKPATVIDVGVAYQTPELYQAFPEADILLVEPLAEFEPFLQKICGTYKAQYVLAAAGEQAGTAVLNVHPDKVGSSLLKEVEGASVDGLPREVPVVTIDQVCADRNLKGPYVVKVDVQGAELQVLAGASETLRETEAVLLEVTLFGTMLGGPQLYDVVCRMKQLGFVLYDIYGMSYRPLDGALCQIDAVFVREHGVLRRSHAFATPGQREIQFREAENYFLQAKEQFKDRQRL
jgi:FkbM family methyltransferase